MVKLEAGKYYKTRDGRKVGPMRRRDWANKHPFICGIVPTPECSVHTAIWECDGKNYELRNLDIVSEWYTPCKAAQVDVQREEYGPDPWRDGTHYTAGPVRTVTETKTRREIVPGVYGCVKVHYHGSGWTGPTELLVQLTTKRLTAEELREAAHLFNQLAGVLDERT